MKRSYLLAVALILISSTLSSQTVQFGIPIKTPNVYVGLLGVDDESFFFVSKKRGTTKDTYFMEKYSLATLKRDYSTELELPKAPEVIGGDELAYTKSFFLGKNLYAIGSSNKKGKRYLCGSLMDKATGKVMDNVTLIDTIGKDDPVNFRVTGNNDKLLINYIDWSKKTLSYGFKLLDENLKQLWSTKFDLGVPEEEMNVTTVRLLPSGKVAMLSADNLKSKKKRNEPNYEYNVKFLDPTTGQINVTHINTNGTFVFEVEMEVTPAGKVVVGGQYSENNESTDEHWYKWRQSHGIFVMEIPDNSGEVALQKTPYSDEILDKVVPNRKTDPENDQVLNMDFRRLMVRQDGSVAFFIESESTTSRRLDQFWTKEQKDNAFFNHYATEENIYHFKRVIMGEFTSDLKIQKFHHLPKDQEELASNFLSYGYFEKNGDKFFLYNDSPENYPEDKYVMKNLDKSVVNLTTIKPDGTQSRQALFSNKGKEVIACPKFSFTIDNNRQIIYLESPTHNSFGIITY